MRKTVGKQGKPEKVKRQRAVTLSQELEGETIAKKKYTDEELIDMRPAKDADHATWRAYHQILFEHGKLNPPEPACKK